MTCDIVLLAVLMAGLAFAVRRCIGLYSGTSYLSEKIGVVLLVVMLYFGAFGALVPFVSAFRGHLSLAKRAVLLAISLLPVVCSLVLSSSVHVSFIDLGVAFSLTVSVVALPAIISGVGLVDMALRVTTKLGLFKNQTYNAEPNHWLNPRAAMNISSEFEAGLALGVVDRSWRWA